MSIICVVEYLLISMRNLQYENNKKNVASGAFPTQATFAFFIYFFILNCESCENNNKVVKIIMIVQMSLLVLRKYAIETWKSNCSCSKLRYVSIYHCRQTFLSNSLFVLLTYVGLPERFAAFGYSLYNKCVYDIRKA